MAQNLTYEEAFEELRSIAAELNSETVSVDVLAERIKRASELIAICQEKLRKTEVEVQEILKRMNPEGK